MFKRRLHSIAFHFIFYLGQYDLFSDMEEIFFVLFQRKGHVVLIKFKEKLEVYIRAFCMRICEKTD